MLLFLLGMDIPTILMFSVILFIFGLLTFQLSRKLLRKIMKDASGNKINLLSRVCAFILSSIVVIGGFAMIIYPSIQRESYEETVSRHYQLMEEDIAEDLKIGMSKMEVIELLGETDTTQSVMMYDLSLADAQERYLLEIKFDSGRLTTFYRLH